MPLTPSQSAAVTARGNVIVVAGAGTGKTSTLVERCLDVIREGSSLDRLLMVTFTESSAAEMRHRLRLSLQKLVDESTGPEQERFAEQLALVETAKISTIHSLCLRLVQSHFHELGLDPEVKVLDDQQCRLLRQQALDELIEECLAGKLPISEAVRALIATYAPDRDKLVRDLALKLHNYSQSLPNAMGWIQEQQMTCESQTPKDWERWLIRGFEEWRAEWMPAIEAQAAVKNLKDCLDALQAVPVRASRPAILDAAEAVLAADATDWKKLKTMMRKPFSRFFDEAGFLASIATEGALESDWQRVRGHMGALLSLTEEFTTRFTRAKRELGGVDFPDLEQLVLRLLLQDGEPSEIAKEWQNRIDYVFVDECQDINAAQDAILSAVGRMGTAANRFLVGDVKQSIYQFRLADPRIFRRYEEKWSGGSTPDNPAPARDESDTSPPPGGENRRTSVATVDECGQRIALTENFRSRPGILTFVNDLFSGLMRDSFGGVNYEPLQAGDGGAMAKLGEEPCVELHLLRKESDNEGGLSNLSEEIADLSAAEREARLIAFRLKELKEADFIIWDNEKEIARKVEWRDMAILMRSPGPRTEVLAKVFQQAGIPLIAERAGFLDAIEVSDLVSLLKLLDNPLQDIPLLAVLRSPLVGLTLDELAMIRTDNRAKPFWLALRKFAAQSSDSRGRDAFHRVPDQKGIAGSAANTHASDLSGKGTHSNQEEDGDAVERIPTDTLRSRVSAFLAQFEQWRELVRQVGPSLCLEQVLTDTGYDSLLSANERGSQQLANVRRLLDLARQFDPYLRQGLYRFLRFLKGLEDAEDSLEPAPAPAREGVRLMSIHKSKGLEFSVVVLAGLGTKFNLSDLHGLVLLDAEYGLAARAVTASGAGRYPTLPFWLAERRQRAQRLGEELRLLYVAATRARDRLICTGTLPKKDLGRWSSLAGGEVSDRDLLLAQCPVNWFWAWLPGVTREDQWTDDAHGASEFMTWELWDPHDNRLRAPDTAGSPNASPEGALSADPKTVAVVAERMSQVYPHASAIKEPAKSSVSALKRRAAELADEEAVKYFAAAGTGTHVGDDQPTGIISAAERGTLHHRFLERMTFERAEEEQALAAQARSMIENGVFTESEGNALDLNRIAAFWKSEVGRGIRAQSSNVRREMPFTARFDDAEVRSLLGQPPDESLAGEFVVVQGVVDLAVVLEDQIWLLDFKTDDVSGTKVAERAGHYRPQLRLYAGALQQIFGKPVRHQWLHFLAAGETVELGEV